MRQKSTNLDGLRDRAFDGQAARALAHDDATAPGKPYLCVPRRGTGAAIDRGQRAPRWPQATCPPPFPTTPAIRPLSSPRELVRIRRRRDKQHDLGAPPLPALVALGLVRHHAGRLQIIQPALHALSMRPHKATPLRPRASW